MYNTKTKEMQLLDKAVKNNAVMHRLNGWLVLVAKWFNTKFCYCNVR